ncbi:hypothetical protein CSX04_07219 [Burkholderia cepacia]|nr:hypothetical protein CSX04_07219 [Burkholderia cepacia]
MRTHSIAWCSTFCKIKWQALAVVAGAAPLSCKRGSGLGTFGEAGFIESPESLNAYVPFGL